MQHPTTIEQQRIIAAALNRLTKLKLNDCFDAANLDSKPTAEQLKYFKGINKYSYRVARGGNQCLAEGTPVMTPTGPLPIEKIQVGDVVYDEHGNEITVLKTFDNGPKEVRALTHRNQIMVEATDSHVFLTNKSKRRTSTNDEVAVGDFREDTTIVRTQVSVPLGNKAEPHAYAIGALLGDGCSRSADCIKISSETKAVPQKVATILGAESVSINKNNYTWSIESAFNCNHYDKWCKGLYAHEKTVDLEEVLTWDRTSVLALVAGIVDTSGSVYVDSFDNLTIHCEMQSKPVIKFLQWAMLTLWQTQVSISTNDRDKYVNGPTYSIKSANNAYTKRILKELDEHLVSPQKKWKNYYSDLVAKKTNEDFIAVKVSSSTTVKNTYDIHVDSPTNLYLLANGLVTHNSGKSQVGARETSWLFQETHPYWERPESWGDEPLLLIVAGRTTKQIEETLWRKIKAFLPDGSYKEHRIGTQIQKVTNTKNGNTILFLSHHSVNEAREKLQSYVAHYVWIDEMPGSVKIIEEATKRIIAKDGYFTMTLTPKTVNVQIKNWVDGLAEPHGKLYKFKMFDNPVYDEERKETILASLKSMPESYVNSVLNGDWLASDQSVYQFVPETMIKQPEGYSPAWRHVEAVDPALKSKFGFTVWAEEPHTGIWYCVKDDYLKDIYVPEEMVNSVLEKTKGLNIVRRIADPGGGGTWFIGMASSKGVTYMTPYKKNERKGDLIKGLQTALASGKIKIAPWCERLIDEFANCQWSESGENKIVNSSSYHLLDSAQYFADAIPKYEGVMVSKSWSEELRISDRKRKEAEAYKQKKKAQSTWKIKKRKRW